MGKAERRRRRRINSFRVTLYSTSEPPPVDFGSTRVYENTDIIEKVHTKFCKFIFGVSKFSHNMPIYGELGCYPQSITIKQRMVCYWTRILKSNQHKLNKVMYEILYRGSTGYSGYLTFRCLPDPRFRRRRNNLGVSVTYTKRHICVVLKFC